MWSVEGGTSVISITHPLLTREELLNATDASHTRDALSHPHLLQTLLFLGVVFGSQNASSLEKPVVRKVFRCRKQAPFCFQRGDSSFFLCESQSEGPQGADFQLPSNSYTFTLALTPATQGSVSFLFYNLHGLQRESTPPRLLRPS